ncbi:MAG: heavy-metal-associated domain-containing protein [Bacteroidales bacterium]|nr:heavy-metal-associated domain-containing protein [Bacteroidales bacterium]
MKTKLFSLLSLFLLGTITIMAQSKTESFKVYGSCDMCETRIEKASLGVDGVTKSAWNKETMMLEISYNAEKTNTDEIQKAIAFVGHDTDKCKADDEVYNKLPNCCKYERTNTSSTKAPCKTPCKTKKSSCN